MAPSSRGATSHVIFAGRSVPYSFPATTELSSKFCVLKLSPDSSIFQNDTKGLSSAYSLESIYGDSVSANV